jgi:hypothetical protein
MGRTYGHKIGQALASRERGFTCVGHRELAVFFSARRGYGSRVLFLVFRILVFVFLINDRLL